MSVCPFVRALHFRIRVSSQNVTNNSSLVCVKCKNMHFGSPSDSWDPCSKAKPSYVQYIFRQGKAELCILELTSVFHHLPSSVSPKQLCALAHLGCIRVAGIS